MTRVFGKHISRSKSNGFVDVVQGAFGGRGSRDGGIRPLLYSRALLQLLSELFQQEPSDLRAPTVDLLSRTAVITTGQGCGRLVFV